MARRIIDQNAINLSEQRWGTLRRPVFALLLTLLLGWSASPAGADAPLAEWEAFTNHLQAAVSTDDPNDAVQEVDHARMLLEIIFAAAVPEARGEKHHIERALAAARLAAASGNSESLLIETELARTRTFTLATEAFIAALESDLPKEADAWFAIIANDLDLSPNDDLVRTMDSYQAGDEDAREDLTSDLMAQLVSKIIYQVDQTLASADPDSLKADQVRSRIEAAAGIGYFHSARSLLEEKLGIKKSARVEGLLHKLQDAVTDEDFSTAIRTSGAVKFELSPIESISELSGSTLVKEITRITAIINEASLQTDAKQLSDATDITEEAWAAFVRIEPQIRRHDPVRYVAIERHFAALRSEADAPRLRELRTLFTELAEVVSGTTGAASASRAERLLTGFERAQPIIFGFLALLASYSLYLVASSFNWKQRAWRNIGLFIMIATVPVFMETIGRLGVELGVEPLQAFSFTANEYAKMVWALLVLASLLFVIAGLRELKLD